MEKISVETIIKVQFLQPRTDMGGRSDFFFGSLAAIFEVFTENDIGCKLNTLWAAKIDTEHPKTTPKCVVSKDVLYRKKQKKEAGNGKI